MTTTATLDPPVRQWLAERLEVAPDELGASPLTASGDSNLMFELVAGGRRWVLRSPPSVKNDRSAHDLLREYRMLVALEPTPVPTPHAVVACEDPTVLGAPFYVMEHIKGFSPSDPLPERWTESRSRRELGTCAAEALAGIARVDWRGAGLDGFGRPDGFLDRQVPRWLRQFESYKVRELSGLYDVAHWLEDHQPPPAEPAILHGDFHLRNVMYADDPPARVVAIVDWEMSTIGDPLLDLGTLLATWSQPGEEVFMNGSATQYPGMASRAELVAAYEHAGGRSLEHIDYYMALALFKLACILEGSYSRLRAGHSEHAGHRNYETLVPMIVNRAVAITTGAWGVG
jgi:aminoglycoside phosphotransferase (APT) family kinase protein